MTFSVENLEVILAIGVRIASFIMVAPIFSIRSVPMRVKLFLSIALTMICYFTLGVTNIEYEGVIGYAILIIKEAILGLSLGIMTNAASYIVSFSGQMIDMNIGFSMMSEFDPVSNQQVTITSNIYTYAMYVIFLCTNMHYFFIRAIVECFQMIPVGGINVNSSIYVLFGRFMLEFMVLAFRIILPIFAAMLITNTVLAVLAKIAPQMNMFVIGHQLKIFIGLFVLTFMILFLPAICDKIFNLMAEMFKATLPFFK